MKTVWHTETLVYYDGPQVFEARDSIGGHYVAVMTEEDYRYLVVGIHPERLRQFRLGEIDLRSLLVESGREERYLSNLASDLDAISVERLRSPEIDEVYLPGDGFTLHENTASDEIVQEARERNNVVVCFAMDPPESSGKHCIRANTLAKLLDHIQNIVTHSFKDVTRDIKNRYHQEDEDMMNVVVPAKPGSFQIILESAAPSDFFGSNYISRALQQIDLLFEDASDPDVIIEKTNTNKYSPSLTKSYMRLLDLLMERNMGMHYSWAEPNSKHPNNGSISKSEVAPLIHMLSSSKAKHVEQIVLEGAFEKFNRKSGAWGIHTDKGSYHGKVRVGGPNLDGLKVGGLYRFYCDQETTEVSISSGKKNKELYLNSHEEL